MRESRLYGSVRGVRGNPRPYRECARHGHRLGGESPVAAGKAADLGGERPLPSIARFGRLACPMRGEATNRDLLGCKRHGRPGAMFDASGGDDLGGKQTWRPEDYRMTAAA
jgi:hypothetical protein